MKGTAARFSEARAAARATEDEAVDLLMAHLRANGHAVELVRRPDRAPHAGRAVDAEVRIDGRIVAVDVTQLAHGAREAVETTKLRRRVSEALAPQVQRLQFGRAAVDIRFARLPPAGPPAHEVAAFTRVISDGLEHATLSNESRLELDIMSPVSWVRKLRLIRFGRGTSSLGWMVTSDDFGGNLTIIAEQWVKGRLLKKSSQALTYDEAWLVIVDRYGLIDADDLGRAFAAAPDLIPGNWLAVWFTPASEPRAVVSVRLPPDTSRARPQ